MSRKNDLRDEKRYSRETLIKDNPADQFFNSITNVDILETLDCDLLPLFN